MQYMQWNLKTSMEKLNEKINLFWCYRILDSMHSFLIMGIFYELPKDSHLHGFDSFCARLVF